MNYTCQIDDTGPFVINSYSLSPQYAPISVGPTRAQVSDMSVTKTTDANPPILAQASANGKLFNSAKITVSDVEGVSTVYQLTAVSIASFQIAGNGNEVLGLHFDQIDTFSTANVDAISGAD